jgi:hypothetical protein
MRQGERRGSSRGSHARCRSCATRNPASGGYCTRLRGAHSSCGGTLRRGQRSRPRHASRIIALALSARLPTILGNRDYVQAGGLLSYGPNFPDLFRRAAEMVDKILHGTKPADIPVEQPTKFDLVLNLKTAKALELSLPLTLLASADEVIE